MIVKGSMHECPLDCQGSVRIVNQIKDFCPVGG
jgi:hypothetical protein